MQNVVLFTGNNTWEQDSIQLLKSIFTDIEHCSYGFELAVFGKLLLLWKSILEHLDITISSKMKLKPEVKSILLYLQDHFSEKVCLKNVSSFVHISAAECCRIFKKAFGCTMTEYLTEIRLQKSVELLLETTLSISEIAFETGFQSSSYFTKQFHDRMQETPSCFRKQRLGL